MWRQPIDAEIEQIKNDPELVGIKFIKVDDGAQSVKSSITELIEAGVVGSLLSILVLFYFLRHWPSTLMVSLAIPLCIVITLGHHVFFRNVIECAVDDGAPARYRDAGR